jgi:hypothetical protein
VTGPQSGPIQGIEVSAHVNDGTGWQLVSFTETSADGSYVLDGLTGGTYRMLFRDWSQVFAFEYHPDAATIELAQDVVASGTVIVDASLDLGGRIAGRVTDASGVPLEYPLVFAYTAGDDPLLLFVGQVDEPTGVYEVGGLPTSEYLMMFTGRRGLDSYVGYYDGASEISDASPIPVVAGETTSGIDGMLGPPPGGYTGGVEGFVTAIDGSPLPNIEVSLYESTGVGGWELFEYQTTVADGSYAFFEVPAGTYTLGFRDWGQIYAFTFWGGVSRLEDALSMEIDEFVVPADMDLDIGGRISGVLTDPSGAALQNALVFVHTFADDPQVLFLTNPDAATGSYELGGLPSGDYIVQFSGYQGLDIYNEYYDGAETIDQADPVGVVLGETTADIDGTLGIPPGGVIAGHITDPYRRSFDFARVQAYQWDGSEWVLAGEAETHFYESEYELPLPPGEYRLQFEAGSFLQFDLPAWEYFDNVQSIGDATPVLVTLDQRIEGFDVAVGDLSSGSISGTVTDAGTGAPLQGIEVWISDRRGRVLYDQISVTAGDGSYTVNGLWPEGYHVEFFDPGYAFRTLSTGQVLVGEGPVDGVDAALELAPAGSLPGSITGGVVDQGGIPVFGIRVAASSIDGSGFGTGYTDSQGRFRIRDLADGDYRVLFSSDDGFWVPEYYDDVRGSADATPVLVMTANTAEGVDAELAPAGIIAGFITNRFGGDFQLATAVASAFDGTAWHPVETTSVVYESAYRLEGLPVGTYRVELIGSSFGGSSLSEFFDDAPTIDLASRHRRRGDCRPGHRRHQRIAGPRPAREDRRNRHRRGRGPTRGDRGHGLRRRVRYRSHRVDWGGWRVRDRRSLPRLVLRRFR